MKIDSYNFGEIVIGGKKYDNDVIIFSDKVISNWWRKEGHKLYPQDLEKIVKENIKILIIGTGYYQAMKVQLQAIDFLKKLGIKYFILDSQSACKKFNELITKKEQICACIHLTC
jgi:hypothetical protein